MKDLRAFVCCTCFGAWLGLATPVDLGAETLTLQEAVDRALTHHPSLQIQRWAVKEAEGQRRSAGQWPNPSGVYAREDLRYRGQEGGEWTAALSLPLGFLWTRRPQVAAASARLESAHQTLAQVKNQLRFAVQQTFVEVFCATQAYRSWQQTTALFHQAAQVSAERLAEGDVGGYEQQRLDLEARQYQQREGEAYLAMVESRQHLALLLGPETDPTTFEVAGTFPSPAPEVSVAELTARSLSQRPDLQAARAQLNAAQAEVQAAHRQALPPARLSAGYKQQEDRFSGVVTQLEMELPLFDRAQGEILGARARLEQQQMAVALLERQITQEVQQSYRRAQLYRDQLTALDAAEAPSLDALLETAQYSYAEGEMDLVGLLDGVRAYSAGVQARYELLRQYQLSLYEMELSTGIPLLNIE